MSGLARRLVTIDAARQTKEVERARQAEQMEKEWRRSWRGVYAQCVGLAVLGYVIYGMSFATSSGESSNLLIAISLFVSYLLPFLRLLVFFVKNADQF